MLSFGHIMISDLVVDNLFMHSLQGMILLYLTTSFFMLKCFCMRYHQFCKDENSIVTQIKHKIVNSQIKLEVQLLI